MTNVPNDLSPSVKLGLFASHLRCKVFLASFCIIKCLYYTNFSNVFDLWFKLSFISKVIYLYGCPFLMTRKILRPNIPRWHHAFFLIRETLSFNLMYVAAYYSVGTTISKTSSLFTALLQHYLGVYSTNN